MTKAPSDQNKSGRQNRLERALRENLMRRKQQTRARRVPGETRDGGDAIPQGGAETDADHLDPGGKPDAAENR